MTEVRSIKVWQANGKITRCEVQIEPPRLIFSGLGTSEIEFEGRDLFESLRALREYLEPKGYRTLCAGARIDVFPSGMSRDMSDGRKAYITQLGVPATEVIDIFDEASPDVIGTVAEQAEHHNNWILSLKLKEGHADDLK